MDPKSKNRALWIVTALLALTFVATGGGKLAAVPPSPANFARWGLSMNFMRFIGAAEVAGGLALLWRPLAPLAAVALIPIMVGAIKTGVQFHETMHIALPGVLIVLLIVVIIGRRDSIQRIFKRS